MARLELAPRWLDWYRTGPLTYRDPFLTSNQHSNEPFVQARFLIENLPDLLKSMPQLQSLQLETPIWRTRSDRRPYAPDLDCMMLAALTRGLIDGVKAQCVCKSRLRKPSEVPCVHAKRDVPAITYGLVTANIEGLSTLDLKLPCAHDFTDLSKKFSDATCNRFRHLCIDITDTTGENGDRDYTTHATREGDNDEHHPASSLQRLYPNRVYNNGVFDFVARCPNLLAREACGTRYLDGSVLVLPESLQTLKICRIRFDASYLSTLLSQVSKVYLDDVELTTGMWNDVWKVLLLCSAHRSHIWKHDSALIRGVIRMLRQCETGC